MEMKMKFKGMFLAVLVALVTSASAHALDLRSCGGTANATTSPQGNGTQVNIVFADVRDCSRFDIIANSSALISYPEKRLQDRADGTRGGSFTIPKRLLYTESGEAIYQVITIRVKSNSGAHQDTFDVPLVTVGRTREGGAAIIVPPYRPLPSGSTTSSGY